MQIKQKFVTEMHMIKKERMAVVQEKGQAVDLDFRDQQIKMNQLSNEQYKGKFRR